jgi:HTH-type transcriptional regulator/antitoxin HigA
VKTEKLPSYRADQIGPEFASTLAKLSYGKQGPLVAKEYLNKKGIHLIFLPHLDQTYLDGACFLSSAGNPVMGLTLRHDRLDNFWFTLLHELGHIHLHLHDKHQAFYDDIESGGTVTEPIEIEANAFAADSFIPRPLWEERANDLLSAPTQLKVIEFAERLNVHPSIIAGRICWELKDFTKLAPLRKKANLRKMFQDFSSFS